MSDSDDPVVIPESPPPPRRSARSTRARTAPRTPAKDASSDDDIIALDVPPITPAQPSASASSSRRSRKKRSSDHEVICLSDSPERPRLKERFTYAGSSAPKARPKRVANTGPSRPRPRKAASSEPNPDLPSVNNVLLPPRNDPPVPVPKWLGKVSVLLHLRDCPVCRRQFKKADAGPARWVSYKGWTFQLTLASHLDVYSDRVPPAEPWTRPPGPHCGGAEPRARADTARTAHACCLAERDAELVSRPRHLLPPKVTGDHRHWVIRPRGPGGREAARLPRQP